MSEATPTRPTLHFERHGDSGPPVLLVMGFGMRGIVWKPQVDGLKQDHRLITYDHRGIGESESPGGHWTMRDLAEDALRVADAAGFDSFHLVGVSMGGMISQHLALGWPERVRSLSLVATHAGGVLSALPTLRGLSFFLRANLSPPAERVDALTELLYPAAFVARADPAQLKARMADSVGQRAKPDTLKRQLGAIVRHRTRSELGKITAPTLVVQPRQDILIRPRESERLHRLIPGALLSRYDESGHGLIFQDAKRLNEELRQHFAKAERRRNVRTSQAAQSQAAQ